MKGNIKYLVFGVCIAFALFGAFISVASATTGYVEEGESIQPADTMMPFHHPIPVDHPPAERRGEEVKDHFIRISASNGGEEWNKTFGGSDYDAAGSVKQTADSGYIIAGVTESYGAGSRDLWLIKTDSSGNKEWDKTFGGSDEDWAWSVQQTTDGGYIIVGVTKSYGAGSYNLWLIKTDANGNKEWDKTFGGSGRDWARSVQQTTDGGYIIAGVTNSYGAGSDDFWLIKTDANGNKEWDKTFGGSDEDWAWSVQQTTDGGYIIAGGTKSYGAGFWDLWLIKTDANGNKEWDKTFGGSDEDWAGSVQQTTDGGYIIAGGTESYGAGSYDFWLIKTDSSGNKEWDKTFGGSAGDWANSVQQTADSGYIIAGDTWSYGAGYGDLWLVKTDSSGDKEWDKTFGGSSRDWAHSVEQTADSGYIIAGGTESYGAGSGDLWLIKVKGELTNQPPVASFTYSPEKPVVNQTVTFNASSSYDPDGTIVSYVWNFGDGKITNKTEPLINHSYSSAGNYNASLTVIDNNGAIDTNTTIISVSGGPTQPSQLKELWHSEVSGNVKDVFSADLDNDGEKEVIAGTDENKIYVFDAKGNKKWEYTADSTVRQVCAADFNGDGKKEVVAGTDYKDLGNIYTFDSRGNLLWKFQTGAKHYWPDNKLSVRTITAGDADNDGKEEIIVGSTHHHWFPGRVCILGEGGSLEGEYWNPGHVYSIQITDMDNDGDNEIVIGFVNNDYGYEGAIALFNGNDVSGEAPAAANGYDYSAGRQMWYWHSGVDHSNIFSISSFDLDGNGINEIIAGSDDHNVYVLDSTGNVKWKYGTAGRIGEESIYASDLDNDGKGEVIAGSYDNNAYCIDYEGNLKWKYETIDPVIPFADDMDNDGIGEVVAVSDKVHVLTNDGEVKYDYPKDGAAYVSDLGMDNVKEIVLGSSTTVYALAIIGPNQSPIASFTYSPKNPIANQNIIFDASNSTDPDGTVTNYEWNFGDNTTGFGKVTTHSYAKNGTYTANLTVTDDKGVTNSTSKEITVGAGIEEEYNPKDSIPTYTPYWVNSYVGNTFTYIIKVQNEGTEKDTIDLTVNPKYNEGYIDYLLSENSVTLAPSESKLINLSVTPIKKTPEENGWNQITINATSRGNNSKISSCSVIYESPSPFKFVNPLRFRLKFNNPDAHTLSFHPSDNVKIHETQSDIILCTYDLNSSQVSSNSREFYVEVTDETLGEIVTIPLKIDSNFNIYATDFDISEDGYSFENYYSYDYSWPLPIWSTSHANCYGMAETSILYKQNIIELPNNSPNTYSLKRIPEVEEIIKAHQNREENKINDSMVKEANELKEYEWGLKWWIDFAKQPTMLMMSSSDQKAENSHMVVAYKIVEDQDKAYIYVYDSNYPYNSTNVFTYRYAIFNETTEHFSYKGNETIQYVKFMTKVATTLPSEKITLTVSCPVNTTITDQYGRIIADNGTNEIPDADMLITNETKIFYLPANLTYSTEIDAYDTGTFNFTRISPIGKDISITKFENISVTASTKASVEIVPNATNYTMSIDYDGDGETDEEKSPDVNETITVTSPAENVFDTEAPANPYPSISGTHNGTIKPDQTITVSKLYTYLCSGTGGHTEYMRIWNNSGWNVTARWEGYSGDWHNISFDNPFILEARKAYNYTIVTGSYPQIHHTSALPTANGWINCTKFTDANGKDYYDWIPAIRLE